ncbi:MAG: hypothetical protein Q7J80_05740 [Anaerolineales bacterium]|nr:hypothetical protein [Anaerolineales bacterium]
MSLFLQLAFLLSGILLCARMPGTLSIRLRRISVLGEMLAGMRPVMPVSKAYVSYQTGRTK